MAIYGNIITISFKTVNNIPQKGKILVETPIWSYKYDE